MKVLITVELDETLFAWEDETQLMKYSARLVQNAVLKCRELKWLQEGAREICTTVTITKVELINR